MNSYLSIIPKYLSAHKKRTRLAIISVAISVALVTGIFSMLDAFLKFEKIQVIHDNGNYHIAIKNPTEKEIKFISSRIDVKNTGLWIDYINKKVLLNGKECEVYAIEEKFASNMNIEIVKGKYPTQKQEVMLEEWAINDLGLELNDKIVLNIDDKTEKEFIITGVYKDLGVTKSSAIPGVFISINEAKEINSNRKYFLIEFKDRINIINSESEIKTILNIEDDRIKHNEELLAVIGQSTHKSILGIYYTGGILFFLVLIAGVMMIYNTFNISVMERTRQFGLLRCVGASPKQIKKMVKREGLYITIKAIPIGLIIGVFITFICTAILKYFNSELFGEISLFSFSVIGITAGIVVGVLTVFIACHLPAKKASKVSPINAIVESNKTKISKKQKGGYLSKILPIEIALGINNALIKKKTLLLMSCSIAISIIIFLGFQVFVDFMYSALKTTKPYTPDIAITSESGLNNIYKDISNIDGVKIAYGRMFDYVEATFNIERLTKDYKNIVGGVKETNDGLFIPPEKSWIVSYEENQLKWAKEDLIEGELSEEKLNENNGIIAVSRHLRKNVSVITTSFKIGDKVYIKTPNGTKEMTVMAILNKVPFSDSELTLTTFVTTEKLFSELTGKSTLDVIDIQLNKSGQEKTIEKIKSIIDDNTSFYDYRQKNAEVNQTFLTMAVFIYGFVAVIALISALNLINTMYTSIIAKTRNLGVMRAIGMSGEQLNKMVLIEAFTYCIVGYIVGSFLGICLQKILVNKFLPRLISVWTFPTLQLILIFITILIMTIISIISPLKKIKEKGITEVIGSL